MVEYISNKVGCLGKLHTELDDLVNVVDTTKESIWLNINRILNPSAQSVIMMTDKERCLSNKFRIRLDPPNRDVVDDRNLANMFNNSFKNELINIHGDDERINIYLGDFMIPHVEPTGVINNGFEINEIVNIVEDIKVAHNNSIKNYKVESEI